MKKNLLILLIILSCCAFSVLKIGIDRIPRQKIPGSSIIYIPSGKYLKYVTFGYSSFAADLIYLWAIQYYSDYSIPDRFEYMDHVFSIISELDHRYLDPYELAALVAVYDAKDINLAFKILDRGLKKNPDQWIFPFQAGHYAQMLLRNYSVAQDYYKKAMEIKGAPAHTQRLYANSTFKTMDYDTAWQSWHEIYNTTEDERIKKIASNHLYQVKTAIDVRSFEEAIERFKESFSRHPQELVELVQAGLLNSLPQDLDGKDYTYDPQTGEVKSPTIPWKR